MGLVFMAEQDQPVRRQVALKVIKPGMDTRQVLARFEAERQALALMDHPNIAKVLDAGTTDAGRPYFVMELVQRRADHRVLRRRTSSPRGERLELFVPVCQAVQHAHQKGIIHRDIKPSNVLVTLHDGQPVPKVIDFGVAKATGPALTDQTLYTGFAPDGRHAAVHEPRAGRDERPGRRHAERTSTRSACCCTNCSPARRRSTRETLRQAGVRRDAADHPRGRAGQAEPAGEHAGRREARSTVSDRRGVDGRQLGRQLRGDLDWVVMTLPGEGPHPPLRVGRRLAADIERYLRDEPVHGLPAIDLLPHADVYPAEPDDSWREVVVAALVAGTGVSIWQAVKRGRPNIKPKPIASVQKHPKVRRQPRRPLPRR